MIIIPSGLIANCLHVWSKICLFILCLVTFQQNPNDTDLTLGNSYDLKIRV